MRTHYALNPLLRLYPLFGFSLKKVNQWIKNISFFKSITINHLISGKHLLAGILLVSLVKGEELNGLEEFVRVSPRDPRYFELTDGTPYIPIGLNLACPLPTWNQTEVEGMAWMEHWMRSLADNHGNFVRVWIGHPFWDIEHEQLGVYDPVRIRQIDRLMELSRKTGVRIKFCMEQFCRVDPANIKAYRNKAIYHVSEGGRWENLTDFLQSDSGRDHFRSKVAWYRNHFGDEPMIFAWELWNEMDALSRDKKVWMDWTEAVFPIVDEAFPKNMVTQSMGSFDYWQRRERHRWMGSIRENDIIQVHRYIDLGAGLDICKGPTDIMAADAVREMRAFGMDKPILLAETGGVEPRHAGPFALYEKDKDGTILHDVLFAPFFAGAAGPGHIWFWDRYVDPMGLWYHFDRFSEAVKNIDPPAEYFEPILIERDDLRMYILRGKMNSLVWIRDAQNSWENELRDGIPPRTIESLSTSVLEILGIEKEVSAQSYDPWKNEWSDMKIKEGAIVLPDFQRSMVLRLSGKQN